MSNFLFISFNKKSFYLQNNADAWDFLNRQTFLPRDMTIRVIDKAPRYIQITNHYDVRLGVFDCKSSLLVNMSEAMSKYDEFLIYDLYTEYVLLDEALVALKYFCNIED